MDHKNLDSPAVVDPHIPVDCFFKIWRGSQVFNLDLLNASDIIIFYFLTNELYQLMVRQKKQVI